MDVARQMFKCSHGIALPTQAELDALKRVGDVYQLSDVLKLVVKDERLSLAELLVKQHERNSFDIFGAKVPEKYMNIIMSAAKGLVDKGGKKYDPYLWKVFEAAGVKVSIPRNKQGSLRDVFG